jgi:hypothetical protein
MRHMSRLLAAQARRRVVKNVVVVAARHGLASRPAKAA